MGKYIFTKEHRRKIGDASRKRVRGPEWRRKLGLAHKGKHLSVETRRKQSNALKGVKSHLWKGGLTEINKQIRHSMEYKLWREAVFKRDNYTCIWCGARGVEIHPDHIKPFADYPELRFAIDNGRTLCKPCHETTDTYGVKNRWKKKELSPSCVL